MQLRREFFLGVGTLVGLNILLAFGAIGLFTRMGPAIERILEENVVSSEAAEEMLSVLIEAARGPVGDESRRRFEAGLELAMANITEEDEKPVLSRIQESHAAALSGEAEAIARVVQSVQRLAAINRLAMSDADRRAQQLGAAGAWAAVFIALGSFLLSAIVIASLERRVVAPLVELHAVLEVARVGDGHRRCRMAKGPIEVQRVLTAVNTILERLFLGPDNDVRSRVESRAKIERHALVHLLEERQEATVLIDEEGEILAANNQGLAILGAPDGQDVRQLLRETPRSDPSPPEGLEPTRLEGGGWLCTIRGVSMPERKAPVAEKRRGDSPNR